MSIRALNWALKLPEVKNGQWRVLMLLCDAANPEHDSVWLSLARICRETGMGRSTVIGHIQWLHAHGYIVPGDKRYVAHLARDKRPNVWMPNTERGKPGDLRGQTLPFDDSPGSEPEPRDPVQNLDPGRQRGPGIGPSGVQNLNPNQELEPTTTTHLPAQANDRAREVTDLGGRVPGAASPGRALEHIAAARAAIRKETTA